ncbi:trypsin-like peptidase domain-containing protein [Gordonia sp. NPDC003585]|uniref:S1C family serine protease n=1 Tax=Gordonia sp. NPDC003585 TaxID=3154275 RepID=UPI0033B3D01D
MFEITVDAVNTENWHSDGYPAQPHSPQPHSSGWYTGSHVPGGYGPTYAQPQPELQPGPPTRRRRTVTAPIMATALIAGLLGGAVGVGGSLLVDRSDNVAAPLLTSVPAGNNPADQQPGSTTYAAQVASKFTADIKVAGSQGTAVGSGIVLSQDGHVLTNNHVVDGVGNSGRIQVTTSDGKTFAASVTGTSPSYDLAVIKLQDASGLTPAALGESSGVKVGQQVVAVGSPENLSNTVTSGIVSALSRTVTAGDGSGGPVAVYNGLQTDTAINPGNSGGPLVNLSGQVIGVNSAVNTGQAASGGVQAFGLGFAIPVDVAKRVANEILQQGHSTKPVLGVSGSIGGDSSDQGARVASVQSGGPADSAGIRQGDVVTKIGDATIGGYADLMAQTLTHTPGDTVPVTVESNGRTRTVNVTLGSVVDQEQTVVRESDDGSGE